MAKTDVLHEAHLNHLQERQKFSGTSRSVDVNEIDINKEPPSREFLEKHIDAERFLDFVSTRSPVCKERPLPKSKKEAIDLMMENPNLIRRPIVVKGATSRSSASTRSNTTSSELRIGTSGWNYPSGKGTWNGVFYPRGRGRKGFDELAFYAEHFDTVEVNSTFYGQPRAEVCRAWAARTPRGFEFSVKLYQKFTHPGMFKTRVVDSLPERRARIDDAIDGAGRVRTTPTSTSSAAASSRWPPAAGSARCSRSFRRASRTAPASRDYLTGLLARLPRLSDRGRTAPPQLERSDRRDADAAERLRRGVGADRRAEIPLLDPAELPARTSKGFYYMRLHGRNAKQLVDARQVRGPLRLPVFERRAEGVRRDGRRGAAAGEEAISTRTTTSRRSRSPTPR